MDITTIIVTVIALACFAIPIAIDQRSKKKKARLQKLLQNVADRNNLKLDQLEIFGNHYALGIDKTAEKLIYVNTENEDNPELLLNLKDFKGCKSSPIYGTKKAGQTNGNDLVHLILLSRNPNSDIKLELFNSDGNHILQNEVQLAEKWAGIIKKSLK